MGLIPSSFAPDPEIKSLRDRVVEAADTVLYRAKRTGRNKVLGVEINLASSLVPGQLSDAGGPR